MVVLMFLIIIFILNVVVVLFVCFDSIVCQICGDFELVLVDGGLMDEIFDIVNIFVFNFGEWLIIYCDIDQGVYDVMNCGVDLVIGMWLFFLGVDDSLYEVDILVWVVVFIGEYEFSDLVYGDVIMCLINFCWGGVFDFDCLLFKCNICYQVIFYCCGFFGIIGFYNFCYWVLVDWDFNICCFFNLVFVICYMYVVVVSYNEFGGFSNMIVDKEFLKWLLMFMRFGIRLVIVLVCRWLKVISRVMVMCIVIFWWC